MSNQSRYAAALALLGAAWVFACDNPQPPALCGTVPEQTITVGESVTVQLCFDDPNGEMLSHRVVSSDPAIATAVATGSTVTVTAISPGVALVTMIATDPTGLKAQQSFRVVVPNRPPTTVGMIADRELMVGDSATLDVSAYFSEPDGQDLAYSAAVSDSSRLSASVEGATVTIVAVAKGDVTVTVTATDPGGLSAAQSFLVAVPNQLPVAVDSIAARIIEVDQADTMDVSPFFADPDGDTLSYAAAVSDSAVVSAAVSGSVVVVTGLAKGEAEVTVTATDDEGLSAEQRFAVTVPNRPPMVADTIPALMLFRDEADTLVLARHFADPDGDALAYAAEASNGGVVALELSAAAGTLTITAVGLGETEVTVTAIDPEGLKAQQSFRVVVPNRPPTTVGTIPDRELMVGDSATLDVSGYFSEPDGQDLAYSAAVSDSSRLSAAVEGAAVTIVAVAKGDVTVTVTATDPGGLSATQSFLVTVPNRPPVAVDSIAARIIEVDQADTVDVSPFFTDPDGDSLTYVPAASDSAVASATVSGSVVVVTGLAKGETEVTVTATDDEGLSAEQRFAVTVPSRPPMVAGTIPALTLFKDEADTLVLARHFADPDGDALAYAAEASNGGVVALELSAAAGTLTITAVGQGETEVTVTALDPEGLAAVQRFTVTVPNRAPVVGDEIPPQTLNKRETASLDLSPHFADPDGDALTYAAETTDGDVVTADVTGATLVMRTGTDGEVTITVTATDPGGLSASQSFAVTVVNRPPAVTTTIPEQTIALGTPGTVDLSLHFADPDGDALVYTAVSSDRVVRVSVRESTLTLRARAKGSAEVTVTATDPDELTAEQTFTVVVANQAPTTVGKFPELTIARQESLTFPISNYFSDPDRDPLDYSGGTANPRIARASVSGAAVTLTGVSAGQTTLTLTATDPDGLTATQTATLTVVGATGGTPTPVGTIPDQTLSQRVERTLNASEYFRDPNGDALRYRATTGDRAVASVSVSGVQMTVRGVATGETTLTVTASDPSGLSAAQTARVVVVLPRSGPVAVGSIPDQLVESGRTSSLYPDPYFQDPDEGSLSFRATSSNTRVVTATASGDEVRLTGVAAGQATVTITATDSDGLSATQTARVTVGQSGSGPEAVGSVPDASLNAGEDLTLDMDSYFRHPSGDPLVYAAGTSDTGVATATMNGSTLTVTARGGGTAAITVVATGPGGRSATQRFGVTVSTGGGGGGGGGGFNISVLYHSSATATLRGAVGGAAGSWESILSGTDFAPATASSGFTCNHRGTAFSVPAGTVVDDLLIVVGAGSIDGSRDPGLVATARLCARRTGSNTPAIGTIFFDTADIDRLDREGILVDVAIHEIGHILGISSVGSWSGQISGRGGANPDPHFTGPLAVAAFNAAGGSSYSGAKVPVQSSSDIGHWRESVLGSEIMTPTLRRFNPLSAITIQALADLGYTVDVSLADAFSLTTPDAADIAGPEQTINMHGDFERGPVMMIDADGNVVEVIPAPPQPPAYPWQPPAPVSRRERR